MVRGDRFGGGISAVATADADAPPPAIAKDTPASPNTGTALLRGFGFAARFACGIAAFLLHFHSRKCCTNWLAAEHLSHRANSPRQGRVMGGLAAVCAGWRVSPGFHSGGAAAGTIG